MPFTLAHPALLLPFRRLRSKWISWSALIIGSMAPDFEAILMFDKRKVYGHSTEGMFLLDLPLGLALWLVFYFIVRDSLVANLPGVLYERLARYNIHNRWQYFRRHLPAIVISLLAGIASHLLWDSLTHQNEWLPWLSRGIVTHGMYIEYYLMLQYLSSVAGLLLVIKAVAALPKIKEQMPQTCLRHRLYWPLTIAIALLTTVLFNKYTAPDWQHPADFYINNTLCGLVAGMLITSLLNRYFTQSN